MSGQPRADERTRISVNGVPITQAQINEEVQYHPSNSLMEAKDEAMQALVVRELLLQEAVRQGLCERDNALSDSEAVIDALLEQEVETPEPDEESCRRYYENNRRRFVTAPVLEVSHIFFPAPPGDDSARGKALSECLEVLNEVMEEPSSFADLAAKHSSCRSKEKGGFLGPITKGQTVPAFEAALADMSEGDISAEPVETEVGFHIIRVDRKTPGENLPFESVKGWIGDYLSSQSWNRAVRQYILVLAGKAEIKGFKFEGAESPLVQ